MAGMESGSRQQGDNGGLDNALADVPIAPKTPPSVAAVDWPDGSADGSSESRLAGEVPAVSIAGGEAGGQGSGPPGDPGRPPPGEGEGAESGGVRPDQEEAGLPVEAGGQPRPDPALGNAAGSKPASVPRSDPGETFYYVKWISWKGEKTPLITQSENGPCPLIAIMNILLLRWKVKLPPKTEVISVEQLMTLLGDCVLSTKPKESTEGLQLNFEQNMNDAMAVLPKLSTGLDVNVRFTGVGDFEYTPECIVFDLLDVPLYHGWLVDPQSHEVIQAVGRSTYNQLVEKIISSKHSTDSGLVSEGLVAEQFLDATATQLTYHGLCELTAAAKDGELCVFFRNNHFSTMIKHK
uniref:ubiquitin carboxyl-terminal hydrolase MINDY-1-like n=1 Tax=Pristiophorus japonicus TaxID=55135 RepID=UPI00398ED0B5